MSFDRLVSVAFLVVYATFVSVPFCRAQPTAPARSEAVDQDTVNRIKEEGLERSQVMRTISLLTDVHGPRLTGSPITRKAGEWVSGQLTEWGLTNVALEPWGPFGRGWTLDSFSANLVEPNFSSLIAFPKAWSPSTRKAVRGEPVYVDASSEADLEKYRGKLRNAIVLISPPRDVPALFEPPAARQSDERLLDLANADNSPRGGFRGGRSDRGGDRGPGSGGPRGPGAPGAAAAPPSNAAPPPAENQPARPMGDPRSAMQLLTDKWQLAYEEGAAVVLEPGRGDGGTVFVASVNMPRPRGDANGGNGGNPFSRGPRPWAPDAPENVPQAVVSVEHYNRLIRMLQAGAHPVLEIDIATRFHADDLNSFNVIAEIPGSDLADELVMLGAHFDSWHSGTGATDNAIGCGVALEAVRILQAVGAKPRRTIRLALWTGEEQGLLGSRAYVERHFGKASQDRERGTPARYEVTPAHAKFSSYFNLDNGTGKIRGVYLQGNEQVRPIFRSWLRPFADMDASTITLSNTGGTDHLSFDGIGLPGFQFIQDPIEYDTRTHHSSMDVYDRVQADDAKQASIIMATFVYQAAMRDEQLPRKPLDGEVVTVESAAPSDTPAGPPSAAR